MQFSEALALERGVTAIIGGGGKTSLLCRLAKELSAEHRVIVATTTHMYPLAPFVQQAAFVPARSVLCVGTPCAQGKITAPRQPLAELAQLADYVLVEADGAKHLPIKAHAAHEPVIPACAGQVICVVGASGLYGAVETAVHRPEIFIARTGERETATPEAVAKLLQAEGLHTRVLINQIDAAQEAARELGERLSCPTALASVRKGRILCL